MEKCALGFLHGTCVLHYTACLYIDRANPFNNKPGVLYHRKRVSPPKLPIKMLPTEQVKGNIDCECDNWSVAEQGTEAGSRHCWRNTCSFPSQLVIKWLLQASDCKIRNFDLVNQLVRF